MLTLFLLRPRARIMPFFKARPFYWREVFNLPASQGPARAGFLIFTASSPASPTVALYRPGIGKADGPALSAAKPNLGNRSFPLSARSASNLCSVG